MTLTSLKRWFVLLPMVCFGLFLGMDSARAEKVEVRSPHGVVIIETDDFLASDLVKIAELVPEPGKEIILARARGRSDAQFREGDFHGISTTELRERISTVLFDLRETRTYIKKHFAAPVEQLPASPRDWQHFMDTDSRWFYMKDFDPDPLVEKLTAKARFLENASFYYPSRIEAPRVLARQLKDYASKIASIRDLTFGSELQTLLAFPEVNLFSFILTSGGKEEAEKSYDKKVDDLLLALKR
jgi:hypothetical protein